MPSRRFGGLSRRSPDRRRRSRETTPPTPIGRGKRQLKKILASMAVLTCAAASLTLAQGKRPMSLVDVLDVPYLTDPQLSPDGRQLLYVLAKADWNLNRRVGHIWRANVERTGAVQLTSGPTSEAEPRWSPDGSEVAFVAARAGSAQVYLMNAAGGEARPLTSHDSSVPVPDAHYPSLSRISWSPDAAWIYFLAFDPDTPAERARRTTKDDVYAFDENHKQRHLWRVARSGKVEQR